MVLLFSLPVGMRIKRYGNLTADNVCECDVTNGYWEEVKHDPETANYRLICWSKDCDAGHELTESGQFKTGCLSSILYSFMHSV